MHKRDPRHALRALKTRQRIPETEAERSLYVLIHGEELFNKDLPLNKWVPAQELDATAYYAWQLHSNEALRTLLEAFLFSNSENYPISQALGVAIDELDFYREIFFDTAIFKNDLECMSWLQGVPEGPDKELLKMAYHQGFAALQWTYCRNKGTVSMDEAERTVLTDSYIQYLSHRGKPLTGKAAKEARGLGKVVLETIKTIRARNEMGEDTSSESIRFKFKPAGTIATVDDFKNKGIEVLH